MNQLISLFVKSLFVTQRIGNYKTIHELRING